MLMSGYMILQKYRTNFIYKKFILPADLEKQLQK